MRLGEGIHLNPKKKIKKKKKNGGGGTREGVKKKQEESEDQREGGWQGLCMKIWRLPYREIASCQKLTTAETTPLTFNIRLIQS